MKILELEHVSKRFVQPLDFAGKIARALGADVADEVVHAVDDVSFSVEEGEVVPGGRIGLRQVHARPHGRRDPRAERRHDFLPGHVTAMNPPKRQAALKVQMIFQDPFASLNPRMRVADIVGEAPVVHGIVQREDLDGYLDELLCAAGSTRATSRATRTSSPAGSAAASASRARSR